MRIIALNIGLYYLSTFICIAQTNDDLLNKKVRLTIEKSNVESILNELTKNYSISFSYEPREIPLKKEVKLPKEEMLLKDVLDILFKNTGIIYIPRAKIIILTKSHSGSNEEKNTDKIEFYNISGKITDKATRKPLSFVNIYITSLSKGAVSDTNGVYQIYLVNSGVYEIKFSIIGYKEVAKYIELKSNIELNALLEEAFTEIEPVTVTPGTYNIATTAPNMNSLSSKEILLSPNFAKDISRTLRIIPGFANNDISSKPRIRGGNWNETSIFIDNFEIYEPYHFEEAEGLSSIFNTDNASDIKISTGGYPAKYTDKMSGIIEVRSPDYVSKNLITASIDFMNTTLYGKMRIKDKMSILYGVRRGYLDLLMKVSDTDTKISPTYYDIWCKLNYQLNESNLFSFSFLKAKNDLSLNINDDQRQNLYFHNIKSNNFAWMNWKWLPAKNYYTITTFGYQDLYASSTNQFIQSITSENLDNRFGKIFILTQNHLWNAGLKHNLEFGFEFKKFQTYYGFNEIRYDLFNSTADSILIDTIHVDSQLNGNTFSAFIEDTWLIAKFLKILPGIRISKQSYSRNWYVAPRLALNAEIVKNLNLRAAWGIYYQPDNFEKLKSFEGQSAPLSKSNECLHYIASLDYKLKNANLKVDIYYKNYKHLTDDFRYDVYNRIPFVIDKNFNTKDGKSKGLEFTFRYKFGKDNILSLCYAYAKNTIVNDLNQETYRNFDRRHSFTINSILNLSKNWSIGFLYMFYTGEPFTPYEIAFIGVNDKNQGMYFYQMGTKNSTRLPNFHTVDFRFSKTWNFKRFQINTYLNIINLFKRQNITGYNWYAWQNLNAQWYVSRYTNSMNIPRFISPGISITYLFDKL